ncbi:hypothetical protein JCM19992_12260 [Thermostilla marina]
MSKPGNILITCGGKWVGHVLQLRRAMTEVPELAGGKIYIADRAAVTPAAQFADGSFVVPPIGSDDYVNALFELCRKHRIRVLVPLIDIDVVRLAPYKEGFGRHGTTAILPPGPIAELCFDKAAFHREAVAAGVPTAPMWTEATLDQATFPVFAKPQRGFGSIGARPCCDLHEARRAVADAGERGPLVFERLLKGDELSVDAYIGREGRPLVAVQRVREQVVGGEAYRSRTVFRPEAWEMARKAIRFLADRGHRGPVNIQMILGEESGIIDVNPRLGSAVVLSNMAAGGRLFRSLLAEACGHEVDGDPTDYVREMRLYRFLGDVFYRDDVPLAVFPSPAVERASDSAGGVGDRRVA